MINDERLPLKERYLEYIKKFPFYRWAAKSIGKSEDTLQLWRKEDKDFAERVEISRAEGMKYFGGRATPDLILKSADPETFKERVDITSGNKPIPILGELSKNVQTNQSASQDSKT